MSDRRTVVVLLESVTKPVRKNAVVLNGVARQVVESRRKKHREYVFTLFQRLDFRRDFELMGRPRAFATL